MSKNKTGGLRKETARLKTRSRKASGHTEY